MMAYPKNRKDDLSADEKAGIKEYLEITKKWLDEYEVLLAQPGKPNWELIEAKLIDVHEWTPEAASVLVNMAKNYGWFFLRNAAALAIACQHEDGNYRT